MSELSDALRAWAVTKESCDFGRGQRCRLDDPKCGPCMLASKIVRALAQARQEATLGAEEREIAAHFGLSTRDHGTYCPTTHQPTGTELWCLKCQRDHEKAKKQEYGDLAGRLREELAAKDEMLRQALRWLGEERKKVEQATSQLAAKDAALRQVVDLKPEPFDFPADWQQQIAACAECARWKDHPIQQGICDEHRRPLYKRDAHEEFERKALYHRAALIARAALSGSPSPAHTQEKE